MNKVTSFEIHLSVDVNSILIDDYANYTLPGSEVVISTNLMTAPNLAALPDLVKFQTL